MDAISPPNDGSLGTLVDLAEWHAKHNPNKPWLIVPSASGSPGGRYVTYAQMNDASHRVAHAIRPGREGRDREVVALVINTDAVLYVAVLLGIIRAGFIVRATHLSLCRDGTEQANLTAIPYVAPQFSRGCGAHA